MAIALASTAEVEVLMALARQNAQTIVTDLQKRQVIIAQIEADLTALSNAIALILNADPFFNNYLQQLILAYSKIDQANKDLKDVSLALQNAQVYRNREFASAMSLLNTALGLILPDRGVDLSQIRGSNIGQTIGVLAAPVLKDLKKAAAVALTIPGICANIAKNLLTYAQLTDEVNGLLNIYLTVLSTFINAYQRNSNLDQAMITFLNSATGQLDSMESGMSALLFPSSKGPLYSSQVMLAATGWGLELSVIIAFLNAAPNNAEASLNTTGQSVRLYQQSCTIINALGNRQVGNATLKISAGQEDAITTVNLIGKTLLMAAQVVVQSPSPANVRAQFRQANGIMNAASLNGAAIITALNPFINTKSTLVPGAEAVVANLLKLANGLGLDRLAGLLYAADIGNIMSLTSNTMTYVGAAVNGMSSILKLMDSNPDTTDQQKAVVSTYMAKVQAKNTTKQIEASRSSSETTSQYVDDLTADYQDTVQGAATVTFVAANAGIAATQTAVQAATDITATFNSLTGNNDLLS
jgi:hypothetical protein